MSTVFETRLIGNIGRDAVMKTMNSGVVAVNFPVAHNKNWKDRKTGQLRTNTTWINCTIWKREKSNMRIIDYLKRGTLVELMGIPFAKAFTSEEGIIRTEIRLNVFKINILRLAPNNNHDTIFYEAENEETSNEFDESLSEFSFDEDDF